MSTEVQKKEKKDLYVVHLVVMAVFMLGFRLIPPPDAVTPYGMAILGIFIGLIYGWSFIGLLIPSVAGAIVLATTGYGSVQDILIAMFTNPTVLMMMFGVFAFAAIQQSGAGDWAVAKLLSSKLARKSPVMIVEIFLLIFLLGNICGVVWFLYFALLPLMVNMLQKCGYEKGDRFNYFLLAGSLMVGQMGITIFPFMGYGLMVTGTMMQLTQAEINFSTYMALDVIVIILIMVTYPLLMKICGCKFDKLANVDIATAFPNVKNDEKITLRQSLAIWSAVVFIAIVVVLSLFGSKIAALGQINLQIGVLGFMAFMWVFLLAFRTKDKKPILDMKEAAEGFPWDMTLLIAAAMLISTVLTSEETGISAWLSGLLMPIFDGMNPFLFMALLALLTIILTNFGNNVALCYVMMSLTSIMYNNGFPIDITAVTLIISISCVFVALMTPAASIVGALLHSCDCLYPSTIYKWTWALIVYGMILLMIVVIPYTIIAG